MSAPVLNRALVLEAPVPAPDGAGGLTETWTALGSLWGELRPRTGREVTGEAGAVAVNAVRVTVRGAPQGASNRPVAGQRFRCGERIFRILAVTERAPDGMYLICETREEVAA
ncbi:head-tail adaptor protein [Salipiger sp. P9]|uniref:head-tail adaptor protein n=1 Tax=Salipiger pentaromativorans TaxID=2943193 RepID=UPI002157B743|nr:head-tail adaptor protein [Salipiger pentaromativorans]MCR8546585.1 head-tail adaptor protein [Salipiger pentaromativorans]